MTTTKLIPHDDMTEWSVCGKCHARIDWANDVVTAGRDRDDTSCPHCGHGDTAYLAEETEETTTSEIRDYTTGRVIGEAEVADDTLAAYEAKEIGQWPEGILAASDLLSNEEIERLGIEANTTVWIEL